MKFIGLLFLSIILSGCMGSGEISTLVITDKHRFPEVKGIDLAGKSQWLPFAFEGDVNVVAIGFEREHQAVIDQYYEQLSGLITEHKRLRFYEVPVIYEMGTMGRWWLNNAMRMGVTDHDARLRTITVYTNRGEFAGHFDMSLRSAYLLILNKKDQVIWKSEGALDGLQLMKMRGVIYRALGVKNEKRR